MMPVNEPRLTGKSWFETNTLDWDITPADYVSNAPYQSHEYKFSKKDVELSNLSSIDVGLSKEEKVTDTTGASSQGSSTSSFGSDAEPSTKSRVGTRRVISFPGSQIVEDLRSANFAGVARNLAKYVGTQTGLIQGMVNYDDSTQLRQAQNYLKRENYIQRVGPWALLAEFAAVFAIVTFALVIGNDPTRFYLVGMLCGVFTYLNGHISGGHSNPAITIACWLRGKMDGHAAVFYILAQTLGAILGASITWGWYVNNDISTAHGHVALLLVPHPRFQVSSVGFCELFYCSILCLLFLTLTSTRANQDNDHYEVMYGLYHSAACAVSTNLTRSYLNPAVALGIALSTTYTKGSAQWVWVYICLDLAAALIAATWFRLINVSDLDHNSLPPKGRNQNLHMQGAFDQ